MGFNNNWDQGYSEYINGTKEKSEKEREGWGKQRAEAWKHFGLETNNRMSMCMGSSVNLGQVWNGLEMARE